MTTYDSFHKESVAYILIGSRKGSPLSDFKKTRGFFRKNVKSEKKVLKSDPSKVFHQYRDPYQNV